MIENIIKWCRTNVTKTGNRALIILFSIFVLSIAGVIIWQILYAPSAKETYLKSSYQEQFNGRVDSLYNDANNHNVEVCVIHGGYLFDLWPEWESQIEQGDALSKQRNSFKVIVIKSNGKKIILDCRDPVKSWN